jgi:hypothetical protein
MKKVHGVADQVHGLSSWVYDVVDRSWLLVLIWWLRFYDIEGVSSI